MITINRSIKAIFIIAIIITTTNCSAAGPQHRIKTRTRQKKVLNTNEEMLTWLIYNSIWDSGDQYKLSIINKKQIKDLDYDERILAINYIENLLGDRLWFFKSDTLNSIIKRSSFKNFIKNKKRLLSIDLEILKLEKEKKLEQEKKRKEKERVQQEIRRKKQLQLEKEKAKQEKIKQQKLAKEQLYKETGANKEGYQLNGINVNTLKYNSKYDKMKSFDTNERYLLKDGRLYVKLNIKYNRFIYVKYKDLLQKEKILKQIFQLDYEIRSKEINIENQNGIMFTVTVYKNEHYNNNNILNTNMDKIEYINKGDTIKAYQEIFKEIHKENLKTINRLKADKLSELL